MRDIVIVENALSIDGWESHRNVEDIEVFLTTRFPVWPENARIYHKFVAKSHDVTPIDELGVEYLKNLNGPLFIVLYPQGVLEIIAIVVLAAVVVAAFVFKPTVPTPSIKNRDSRSANNELSGRTNEARLNGRIPDIFGTVRSIPDLIAVPYSRFENNQEVEDALMCIGRGAYQITGVPLDGSTRVTDIQGMSVEIWAPNTSPNSNDEPQDLWGPRITDPLLNIKRFSTVNGQVLRPPNEKSYFGASDIIFDYPNRINAIDSSPVDFQELFESGDTLSLTHSMWGASAPTKTTYPNAVIHDLSNFPTDGNVTIDLGTTAPGSYAVGQDCVLENAIFYYGESSYDLSGTYEITSVAAQSVTILAPHLVNSLWLYYDESIMGSFNAEYVTITLPSGAPTMNLNGTYSILSVSRHQIILDQPGTVNSAWNNDASLPSSSMSPRLTCNGPRWVGPFTLDITDLDHILSNFVAMNGLYKDDGQNQYRVDVTIALEVTPVNAYSEPIGSPEKFTTTIIGSANDQDIKGVTLTASPTFTGRCSVRACRESLTDTAFNGTVTDEVKWRDVYGCVGIVQSHFGDITLVRSKTYATTGALNVKERKLNVLVTRKIPQLITSNPVQFTSELYPTNRADEIMAAVIYDDYIGRMNNNDVDIENIYSVIDEVATYFGTEHAVEFNYTFDQNNYSFEETIAAICSTVYCKAYRRGRKIKIVFEKETNDSVLLFNKRNKVPNTETRTYRFGILDEYDGVEIDYVDPTDDATVTYYLPNGTPSPNSMKIETVGIRNKIQAYFHAWRTWNKIQYQSITTEFEGTQEADLVLLTDRILVEDNTRLNSSDGEILAQNGLVIKLSQPGYFQNGHTYTIFLQLSDGTVEARQISSWQMIDQAVLDQAPRLPLSADSENYARATYTLVDNGVDVDPESSRAFLVAEKNPRSNMTMTLKAYNYDPVYYEHDKDVVDNIVDEENPF